MCPHEIQICCENSIGHNNGATFQNTGFLQTQSLSLYIHLRTWNSDINCERILRIQIPTKRIEFSFVDWMCSVCYARYVNFNQTTFHGCGLWGFASVSAIRCAVCVWQMNGLGMLYSIRFYSFRFFILVHPSVSIGSVDYYSPSLLRVHLFLWIVLNSINTIE